ncbi:GNAT family N-acetyltransferase [Limnovirga soli]|uniref:GNAT family N-acetyltransferase n=1 Tax=Limnovirga soli TaxID=2656915 RepID=A0A8J8JST0_9BACT|nr:GNAT family N-acetyltransferase [Limnovirga soli]NNV57332.1 GNAT family N-acetyltransferase [Limnovirga soli]
MQVQIAKTDADIEKCLDVMLVLRPHLQTANFLPLVKEMMQEGYILAFIENNGKAASVVGYRYQQYLYNGKHYYIDDLSTLPEERGHGFAGMLIDFVCEEARKRNYTAVTLDSGYTRFDAHRLYLNKGFTMVCHHFSKTV